MYVPTVDVVVEHPSLPRLLVTSLLLGKEVTLRIPLSIEQVQQRLLDQMRIGITYRTGSGIFKDTRRYKARMNNSHFVIDGPFGHKKWKLFTQGQLLSDSFGVTL